MNNDNPSIFVSQTEAVSPGTQPTAKPKKKMLWLALAAVLLVAAIGTVAWGFLQHKQSATAKSDLVAVKAKLANAQSENKNLNNQLDDLKNSTGQNNIDTSAYQAVFLKNEQVYFGKITILTETQVVLTDIFYIKQGSNVSGDVNNPQGSVSLVKLGDEVHAPQDTMYIERAEMNFWENLKPNGQVAKAIDAYNKQH